jgi:hypothetical protein
MDSTHATHYKFKVYRGGTVAEDSRANDNRRQPEELTGHSSKMLVH